MPGWQAQARFLTESPPRWAAEAAAGVVATGAGLCRHPLESYRRFRPPAARVVPAGVDESSDRPC